MPARNFLIIDAASAPIEGVEAFIDNGEPPANYKNQDAIDRWQADYRQKAAERAALDFDLARVTAIGMQLGHEAPVVTLCRDEDQEKAALQLLAEVIRGQAHVDPLIVTYNGHFFDIPLLQRRALYLGVSLPYVNIDRYRSPNADLCAILSGHDPSRRKSLGFYVRRLGFEGLIKPLSGADEANVFQTGSWAELEASVVHDMTAAYRLAQWLKVI